MSKKLELLQIIEQEVSACQSCSLHQTRIKYAFAKGNPEAEIVFIGEALGQEESIQGVPFVGRAGKLLDSIIAAMGLNLQQVYVTNVVKDRPPNNRKPMPEEMKACMPFLARQLDIIRPKVIIALGATATEALLGPGEGITRRHGQWGEYLGIKVMPVYHPSFLLRKPEEKETVRQDLKKVLEFLKTTGDINNG